MQVMCLGLPDGDPSRKLPDGARSSILPRCGQTLRNALTLPSLDEEPLEVFHYHKAIIPCNYKLWHDTNCEFYHDFLDYHNRITGFNDAYFARKNTGFDNGHINVGSFEVQYDNYEGSHSREEISFPHLPPNHWYISTCSPV